MAVGTASIAANLERVRLRIGQAAQRAGRRSREITVVAVSKTFPAECIRLAYQAGVRHFGENRVQEWESKQPVLSDLEATWHLVGHLQSNKAARAVRVFHTIDSLDRMELAQRLNRILAESGGGGPGPDLPAKRNRTPAPDGAELSSAGEGTSARLPVLIEVRLAPEETKSGVEEAGLAALAEAVMVLPHLELRGLMCIPPYLDDAEQVRPYFRRLRELRDALANRLGCSLLELSMGMSHDFEVAIEEGATQVRLGTAIFGARS